MRSRTVSARRSCTASPSSNTAGATTKSDEARLDEAPGLELVVGTDKDLDDLFELFGLAWQDAGRLRDGVTLLAQIARPDAQRDALLELLADNDHVVVLARYARAPAGLALGRLEPRLWSSDSRQEAVVLLRLVYVAAPFRRLGIGERLVEEVTLWGRRHGACSIDAHALPGDRATKSLFEVLGLRARLLTMSKPITPSTEPMTEEGSGLAL